MQTKRFPRALLAVLISVLFVLSMAVVLLETAFFHINPIKIGFNRLDYGRYVILAKGLPVVKNDFETISKIMSKNEAALGLHYNSKVQVILCEKQSDLNRFQPFLSAVDRRNAVSVAPWPNTIYITPRAKEKYGSILGPLGHELSHILLLQNYGIARATLLWKVDEWIPEGFATYVNNWPDYFSRDQLLEKSKDAGVEIGSGGMLGAKHATEIQLPVKYMVYRYFVEYLFQRNPATTVIQFVKEAINNPNEAEIAFERNFKDSFDSYVKSFRKNLNEQ